MCMYNESNHKGGLIHHKVHDQMGGSLKHSAEKSDVMRSVGKKKGKGTAEQMKPDEDGDDDGAE